MSPVRWSENENQLIAKEAARLKRTNMYPTRGWLYLVNQAQHTTINPDRHRNVISWQNIPRIHAILKQEFPTELEHTRSEKQSPGRPSSDRWKLHLSSEEKSNFINTMVKLRLTRPADSFIEIYNDAQGLIGIESSRQRKPVTVRQIDKSLMDEIHSAFAKATQAVFEPEMQCIEVVKEVTIAPALESYPLHELAAAHARVLERLFDNVGKTVAGMKIHTIVTQPEQAPIPPRPITISSPTKPKTKILVVDAMIGTIQPELEREFKDKGIDFSFYHTDHTPRQVGQKDYVLIGERCSHKWTQSLQAQFPRNQIKFVTGGTTNFKKVVYDIYSQTR